MDEPVSPQSVTQPDEHGPEIVLDPPMLEPMSASDAPVETAPTGFAPLYEDIRTTFAAHKKAARGLEKSARLSLTKSMMVSEPQTKR